MSEVSVRLMNHLPLWQAVYAARLCADSLDDMKTPMLRFMSQSDSEHHDRLHEKDEGLLRSRILAEDKMNPAHESVLEHVVYTFLIEGVSRALLQELMRHRIASPSVQSTRYALKKLVKGLLGIPLMDSMVEIDKLIVLTGDDDVDELSRKALIGVVDLFSRRSVPNDRIKFSLPESFKTKVMLTINARSLRNLFVLRTSKRAMWEIRRMAFAMVDTIPKGHMFMFEDRIHDRPERFRKWMDA